MEEFAERHSREMVVRDCLGAMIPSAGVGTCLTRRVILYLLRNFRGVMAADCLTEDYVLGAEVHRAGFSSIFVTTALNGGQVATREYFPKDFWASVRQKTRWTYGIAFEATRRLGWGGNFRDRYFLYRDRKGAVANLLPPVSLLLVFLSLAHQVEFRNESAFLFVIITGIFNTAATGVRYWVKVVAVREIYGFANPVGILKRWPVAVVVNFLAAAFAWQRFFGSAFATRPVAWDKTQHELPENFARPRLAAAGAAGAEMGPTNPRSSKARTVG
jgi:adsorption protein B